MKITVKSVEQDEDVFKVTVSGDDFRERVFFANSRDSLLSQLRRLREMNSDREALEAMIGTTVEV